MDADDSETASVGLGAEEDTSSVGLQDVRVDDSARQEIKAVEKGSSTEYTCDEHLLTLDELAVKLRTSINVDAPEKSKGLSSEEAAKRLTEFGKNAMSPPKELPELFRFLLRFTDKFMILLLIAGILCHVAFAIDQSPVNNILGIVLYCVMFANCTAAHLQERQTTSVMNAIKNLLAASCTVVRDGRIQRIDPALLVPGDVVRLGLGDRVPADMRMIFVGDLKTEQSSLTGEPDAVSATVTAQHDVPIESRNLVFSSSLVMNGEGFGVVYRTGDKTMIGSIAALAGSGNGEDTQLQLEVSRFVKFVATLAVVTSFAFFIIGMSREQPPISTFVNGFILVIVANVPQGLPATVRSCLSVAAKRMAARNVLIKRPHTIEALGSASVIASDKTGTLTQNKMTVENLWYNHSTFSAFGGNRADLVELMQPAVAVETAAELMRDRSGSAEAALLMSKAGDLSPAGACATTNDDGGGIAPLPAFQRPGGMRALSLINAAMGAGGGNRGRGFSLINLGAAGPPVGGGGGNRGRGFSFNPDNVLSISSFANVKQLPWSRLSPNAKLITLASVCNRARFAESDSAAAQGRTPATSALTRMMQAKTKERKVLGDASDSALLRYCEKLVPVELVRANFPKVFEVPFNSVVKYSLAIVTDPGSRNNQLCFMKGAPEIVLSRCTEYMYGGATRPIDDAFTADWLDAYERFGSMGERVLGLAYKPVPTNVAEAYKASDGLVPKDGFVFCGLISLVDPPRDGVAAAIQTCRQAGVKVTMVTGDHPLTAEAIARKVNIITGSTRRDVALDVGCAEEEVPFSDPRVEAVVLSGSQLNELTLEEWDAVLSKEEVVFARTSPQQKLTIVEHYQRRGEVVAVTGDGVNDSPALKRAQIGVAMGGEGASDVAREAADMILLDDNFASIVGAIEEGRTLFDNLKKTFAYSIAHLWPEIFPAFLNLAFSFPLALNGLLILTIDLLTEQGPAISLAFEQPEARVMLRPPRDVKRERLVSWPSLLYSYVIAGIGNALTCTWAFFMVFISEGISVSNLAFTTPHYFNTPKSGGAFADDTHPPNASGYPGEAAGYRAGVGPAWWLVICDGVRHDEWAQDRTVIEAKMLEPGCAVFSPQRQYEITAQAQSAYYLTLIMCQFWHVWHCRTRLESVFRQGITSNVVTIFGTAASVGIMVAIIYVPIFHNPSAFGTADLGGYFWLPNIAYGIFITALNEFIKYHARNHPDGRVAKTLAW